MSHRLSVGLLVSLFAVSACDASTPPGLESSSSTAPAENVETTVESLIRRWFDSLEDPNPTYADEEPLFGSHSIELSLTDGVLRSREEVEAFRASLHSAYVRVDYEIQQLSLDAQDSSRVRARVVVDRTAWDAEGVPHVGRWEQTWWVDVSPSDDPTQVRIEERRLPFFPGTGPQILCF